MKTLTAALFTAFAISVNAEDTNKFTAPLNIKGTYYTNATISSVNAAYVTLLYDGGGKKFLLSDLPEDLQQRFNYDPDAAQRFLAAEADKKSATSAKIAEAQAEELKALNTVGDAQSITVVRVDGGTPIKCLAITPGGQQEIFIRGLPASIEAAFEKYAQAQAQVDNLPAPAPLPMQNQSQQPGVTSGTTSSGGGGYGGNKAQNRQARAAAAAAAKEAKAESSEKNGLPTLKKEAERQSKIKAKPTGLVYGGCRMWIFDGFASTNEVTSTPPAKGQ